MAQEQGRFSPSQILMAAEKAEADGRLEHAVQFYRYIIDQQSGAPEADLARVAMERLLPTRHAAIEPQRHSAPAWPSANEQPTVAYELPRERTGQVARYPQPAGAGLNGQHRTQAYGGAVADPPPAIAREPAAGRVPPRGEPLHGQARMPVMIKLPEPKRGYRSGRALAMLMTISGGLLILGGIALIVAGLLAPRELQKLAPGLAAMLGFGWSVGAIFTGAALLLFGQLARAVFDAANAARELVSLERALARQSGRPATGDDE